METKINRDSKLLKKFRLTSAQLRILDDIMYNDGEILVENLDNEISYRVRTNQGDYIIRNTTFDRLMKLGLIRYRGETAVGQERWW